MSAEFPAEALEVMQGAIHGHDAERYDACAWIAQRVSHRLLRMPLASRLALARALVPGWAVVPVEPTEAMCNAGADELPTPTCESTDEEAAAEIYRAMLTAAEEPPHGP